MPAKIFPIFGQNETARPEKVSRRGSGLKAAVVTLGCAKNQVDSEVIAGALEAQGFALSSDLSTADVAIVNTCGFLESAVKESIDCVLELAERRKKEGYPRRIVVAGCLVERYKQQLKESLPEADSLLLIDDITRVAEAAELSSAYSSPLSMGLSGGQEVANGPRFLYDEKTPRLLSTASHTAYVKISDGCNRPCAFCIIPSLRGSMRSRHPQSIIEEVKDLAGRGVKEINVIAQDTTAYGGDLTGGTAGRPSLSSLLRMIDELELIKWQRVLYAYPSGVTSELLNTLTTLPSACSYLDIPLQHSSVGMLKAMRRPIGKLASRELVERIRTHSPNLTLRTTFITGFPGESEDDVKDLENFILEGHFLNVGIFAFSREEGTHAHSLPGQIPAREKEARRKQLMRAQQKVLARKLEGYVGRRETVIIEGPHPESDLLLAARTRFQAPEVDGAVIINDVAEGVSQLQSGRLAEVEFTAVLGYDLAGKVTGLVG